MRFPSRWRFPILFATAALLFVALADWVFIPMNERGELQWACGWLDGASRLLQAPGLMVARKLGLGVMHHAGLYAWSIMMAFNVPVYLAGSALLRWMWLFGKRGAGNELAGAAPFRPLAPSQALAAPSPGNYERSGAETTSAARAAAAQKTARAPDRIPIREAARRDHSGWRSAGAKSPPTSAAPRSLSRRQILAVGNRLAVAGAAGLLGYAFAIEPQHFQATRRSIAIRGLPASLDGLTIAQITDIHHGPWTPLSYVRRIVAATNGLNVDLIALTGDYVLYSRAYIKPVVKELSFLRAKIGIVATMGNHDWWEDGFRTIAEFRRVGIPLIDNDRRFLSPDRQLTRDSGLTQGLCVAGIGDLWEGSPDFDKALAGVSRHLPRLLLSHNPDAAESPAVRHGQYRVDLMLSGHTHGGQVWLPGLGTPMIPSNYGQKYARGLVNGPAFPVFISHGLGTTSIPLRFCRPPEIAVIRLESAPS